MAISNFYYDDITSGNFINMIYASHIAMENHYHQTFFSKEKSALDRIIYASNEYAFRKRTQNKEHNILDLPFMNYYIDDITQQTDRKLWHNIDNVVGRYVPELQRRIKMVPVTISYSATLFVKQTFDLYYATSKIMIDDANETTLYPEFTLGGYSFPVPAFLGYSHSFDNEFNENDWLEQNQILTLGLDVSLETYLMIGDGSGSGADENGNGGAGGSKVSIAEDFVFTFLSDKNLNKKNPLNSQTAHILLQKYFSKD